METNPKMGGQTSFANSRFRFLVPRTYPILNLKVVSIVGIGKESSLLRSIFEGLCK